MHAFKRPAVYIMTNKPRGTLYTGVTSNLIQCTYQHREGILFSFTSRYDCKLLVRYEMQETMENAILREKQIKGGSRKAKLALVQGMNPEWRDLFDGLL